MAASVDFNSVLGFYVPIGSTDYPASWSPSVPFGFDTGSNVSVYQSNMNDVSNVFVNPVNTTKAMSYQSNPSGLLSSLTIERPSSDFNMVTMGSNNPNDEWVSVFRIIEYI